MLRAFCLFAALLVVSTKTVSGKEIVGWVEKTKLGIHGIEMEAKIDSGAENSSLHLSDGEKFEKDGTSWIRLKFTNSQNETIFITSQILRVAKIKRHDGQIQLRNVIEIEICLGTISKKVEVNLIDRTGFDYQLLIGRSFLGNDFLIDVTQKHISEPKCK